MMKVQTLWQKSRFFKSRRFSTYANYSSNCQSYDTCRKAIGLDVIKCCINNDMHDIGQVNTHVNTPKNTIKILDAGCGTGNYIEEILSMHLNSNCNNYYNIELYGIDLNERMLDCATKKLCNLNSECSVQLFQGSILQLSQIFDSNHFDCILVNQALHHLDTEETRLNDFFNVRMALNQMFNILKPHGVLCINHSSPQQLLHGIWFYSMLPVAAQQMSLKFPSCQWFFQQFNQIGFDYYQDSKYFEKVIFEPFIKSNVYFDFEGPFKHDWRSCDSIWNLATSKEINQCQLDLVKILQSKDQLNKLNQNAHLSLQTMGHSTTLMARKPYI